IYTSGSTGRPKGAMNTHRGIVNRLFWMQEAFGLTPEDRVVQKTPFSFDVSVWEFFWPLFFGAQLVIAEPGGHRDSGYLAQLIVERGITTIHFVPSMLQLFLEDPRAAECASLRRVICSGEALPKAVQDRFFSRLDAELHNLYGPTEAAIDVTDIKAANTGTYIGRNAVSSIDVTDALIEANTFDKIGLDAWDIEPNFDGQQVRRNVFRSNHIGAYSLRTESDGWLLSTWNETTAPIEDITLADNDVLGVGSKGHGGGPRGLHIQIDHSRTRNVVVTNNRTSQPAPGPVMHFVNVDGLIVDGNVQPLASGDLETFEAGSGRLRIYLAGLVVA